MVFPLASTISSDGFVRVFDLTPLLSGTDVDEVESIAAYDTKHSRLTCLAVAGFDPVSKDDVEAIAAGDDGSSDMEDSDEDAYNSVPEDEDSENELARLEDEVKRARETGLVIDDDGVLLEGDEDEDVTDSDSSEEHEVESEGEQEEA